MAKKKRTAKKTAKTSSSTSATPSLDTASVAELERELAERKRGSEKLLRKRERVLAQLADIDAELAEMGISPSGSALNRAGGGGGGRTRPRNDKPLPEAMVEVMRGKQMGVSEIAEAVQAAGYKTSSANFRTIVNQALIRETDLFKKVSRGVYTAK